MRRLTAVAWIAVLAFAVGAPVLGAQGATFRGKVLTDSTELPIAGVVVSIDDLKLQASSDSAGNFVIVGIKPGAYVVTAKKIGFGALATRVRFAAGVPVEADLLLTPNVQALPDVKVETKPAPRAKLVEFEERRSSGAGGKFLSKADFDKRAWSATADVFRQVPGIELLRDASRPSQTYVQGGRLQVPGGAFANGGNKPPPCFSAVVLDGAFVFQGNPGEPPFDINSISPTVIAGVEFYQSSATIPAKYNGTRNTCGLVVIWTR